MNVLGMRGGGAGKKKLIMTLSKNFIAYSSQRNKRRTYLEETCFLTFDADIVMTSALFVIVLTNKMCKIIGAKSSYLFLYSQKDLELILPNFVINCVPVQCC